MTSAVYRLLRDPNRTKFDLTTIQRYINEGEQRYCTLTNYSVKKDTSISTAASTREYSLPTDCKSIIAVFLDGSPLYRCEVKDTVATVTATGDPTHFYIRNMYIGMEPVPTAVDTVTIIYRSFGGDMINTSDNPILPEEDHMLPVYWACYWGCVEADDNRAAAFNQAFYEGVRQAVVTNVEKAFNEYPTVGENTVTVESYNRDVEGVL